MSVKSTKTLEELDKLETKRLLAFYKAERNRFYKGGFICNCGCGEFLWETKSETTPHEIRQNYFDWKKYLEKIKALLDIREHIKI